ncbi:Plexin-B-like protein [Leptotrombidium deliense]|uniref:Plexin-B-like protein n=1 Tax=Leptotrombidium deliense TaxID=299467 RepID=A0A443SVY2_9ACAR|nr:Plexin-B-like protein [Leptotrombidium deliense]
MNIRKLIAYIYSMSILLWIARCQSLVMAANSDQHVEPPIHTFYATANKNINFTHLISDKVSGRVYVGAVNWIYQFTNDLKLEFAFQSGPVKDSPFCSPSDCSSVDVNNIKPTNNVNKVLVIDPEASMLIVCGSVHQGSCRRHKLEDIRKAEPLVQVPVAANDENSSTVAFIGPARYSGSSTSLALYVAVTNSCLGPYRSEVPAVSSRSLDSGQLFTVIEKSFPDSARVDINFHLRDYYLVKYVYGFHSRDFVYFATVQRKSSLRALEEWGYVTRLARICDSDPSFHSYAEITIQCFSQDGVDLNILQAAVVVRVGSNLANKLRVEKGSHLLIGVFASSKDHTTKVSSNSGICMFPLSKIENKFKENILMCYNGTVLTRNMDYIAGSVNECPKSWKTTTAPNFCNEAVKLNGSLPLFANAAITYQNTTLTSITATTTGQHTVAFAGTSAGAVKKILLSSETSGEQFEEILIDKGNPINTDMVIDGSQKFIFVASPYKVAKIRAETCNQYTNCNQCLSAKNPYCGWCPLKRKCTPKSDCDDGLSWKLADKLLTSSRWLPMESSQCSFYEDTRPSITTTTVTSVSNKNSIHLHPPRIDWIHPLSGPVEGGTLVTIEGSNLGANLEEIKDKIFVGGVPCVPMEYTVSVRVVCRTGPSTRGVESAVIEVANRVGVTRAQEKFQYKRVHLDDVYPKFGPKSGGTAISLTGFNFNIGSNIEVFLDDFACDIKKSMIANKQIICRTTGSVHAPYIIEKLRLKIDGANLTLLKPFTFVDDPKITSVFPQKSFVSGGRYVKITGTNLSSVQQPKMGVLKNNKIVNETICNIIDDSSMLCPSPSVEQEMHTSLQNFIDDNNELKFQIAFEMDSVQSVRDLEHNFPQLDAHLYYVPDPKILPFNNNGILLYKGDSLVIDGENLRSATTEAEVNVTIGTKVCNLTSLSMTQLICTPPEVQPEDTDELGRRTDNNLPAVVVTIGKNLRFNVGYLRYEVTVNNEIPPLLIGLISATGAFLMLLSLILLAVFRHKREPRRPQPIHSTRRLRRSRRPIADHSQTTHRPLTYLADDTKNRLRRLADFADITYHSQTTLRPLADFADVAYHTQTTLRPIADPSQTTLRPLEDISDDTKNRLRRLADFADHSQNTYRANYYY